MVTTRTRLSAFPVTVDGATLDMSGYYKNQRVEMHAPFDGATLDMSGYYKPTSQTYINYRDGATLDMSGYYKWVKRWEAALK